MKTRGFNQVKKLFGVRDDLLCTNKKFQQSNNNRYSRLNIDNPFKITKLGETLVRDKRVLILDDVYTTGTTLRMAAKIVKNAGAKMVNSFSLMR
jgi:competence protein ComFC